MNRSIYRLQSKDCSMVAHSLAQADTATYASVLHNSEHLYMCDGVSAFLVVVSSLPATLSPLNTPTHSTSLYTTSLKDLVLACFCCQPALKNLSFPYSFAQRHSGRWRVIQEEQQPAEECSVFIGKTTGHNPKNGMLPGRHITAVVVHAAATCRYIYGEVHVRLHCVYTVNSMQKHESNLSSF